MKIKEITYLVPPRNLVNDYLDVFLTLENYYSTAKSSRFKEYYNYIEVTTPHFLSACMEQSKGDFLEPGYLYIIVAKLTDEIIQAAIEVFIDENEDSFWVKLYHIIPT